MAEEFKPGQIVPESGVYRITHDPVHAEMPHEVTVIKGRRFPTCRHCKGVTSAFTALMDRGHVVGQMFCVLSTLSFIALISARPTCLA